MEQLLLRASEAAQMLGIGRSTVYELAAKGSIPSVCIGARLRFPRDRLLKWIQQPTRQRSNFHRVSKSFRTKR